VLRRGTRDPDGKWELVGRSPIQKYKSPLVDTQWRIESKGYAPVERSFFVSLGDVAPSALVAAMDREREAVAGMVHQTDGLGNSDFGSLQSTPVRLVGLPGFEDLPPILLGDYWIDRYEVTNKQFQDFLDSDGYKKREYWKNEFLRNGRKLSWVDAMALFHDATGRPGPAGWELGRFPPGQADFPVSGVSWYEAAAYAEFAGKSLPTIYHWTTAASLWAVASIVPISNFGKAGLAPVGISHAMSWFGSYDMAGNAKEWCWNEAGAGRRYIMGGAWDEPMYMFNDADARSPFERSADFGFRCARYNGTGLLDKAAAPVILSMRDFTREKPVSDSLFRAYKSLYSYDKTQFRTEIELMEDAEDWKRLRITFPAAYGNEEVIAYLFLPKKTHAPFQTVVYFPGSYAIDLRSSATLVDMGNLDFLIRGGGAVLAPVFKGTYERGDGLKSDIPNMSSFWRDHVIAWSKDLSRSLDYLETRSDVDRNRIAYMGFSWGGAMGSVLPALEQRIKACVLLSPGFNLQRSLPEVDEINFAPRVKVPVLMLNGRFDFFYPIETSQEPLFQLLGTSKQNKKHLVYETGHMPSRHDVIKETLDWLDRYLGPVN